jgi:hypothetical protein
VEAVTSLIHALLHVVVNPEGGILVTNKRTHAAWAVKSPRPANNACIARETEKKERRKRKDRKEGETKEK